MPAYIEVDATQLAEMDAITPDVTIDGELQPYATCLSITDTTGVVPSQALIRIDQGTDTTGPVTLNRYKKNWTFGSRVEISVTDSAIGLKDVLFVGSLMERNDMGQDDTIIWTAYDDRTLLTQIPIRGCVVYDSVDSVKCKLLPRYVCRTNPNGYWNCVGVTDPNNSNNIIPIFADKAKRVANYESPDQIYPEALSVGEITAWTPRRFLMYLRFLATTTTAGINGMVAQYWRSLYGTDRLDWPIDVVAGMVGKDPAITDDYDPLDKKMADMTFQGDKMLLAIDKALRCVGTHGLKLRHALYPPNSVTGKQRSYSVIDFYPKSFSGLDVANKGVGKHLRLQRSGSANDVNSVYDFQLSENALNVRESVLVEGASVKLETELLYECASDDTLKRAWSGDDEYAFLVCINGSQYAGNPGTYALIPPNQGQNDDVSDWVDADGTSGKPFAEANTAAAANLARQIWPQVFKAFYIDNEDLDALAGSGSKFSNENKYPRLKVKGRPILPEQLQFLVNDLGSGGDITNMLLENYPVRIQVKAAADTDYHDTLYTVGLRVTPDGFIWLDGIGENLNGRADCIYEGDYTDSSSVLDIELKSIKINAAMPMDHRVLAYTDIGGVESKVFSQGYRDAVGGFSLEYIDSPGVYKEAHQVDSKPAPNTSFYSGVSGASLSQAPLTRILPPGSEEGHAEFAANRALARHKLPERNSVWKMPGIRPEYRAGDWIFSVELVGGASGDTDYDISAPIESITYDFMAQETHAGGLLSSITGA